MKIIITFLVCVLYLNIFSQSYTTISYYYYSYIEICIEFQKTTPVSTFGYSNVLGAKQYQYDNAHKRVSIVYGQMEKLQLLNKENRSYLNTYRNNNFSYIANTAGQIDLSIPQNESWAIDNFRKPLKSNKNIRNEIKVLAKLGKELDFIDHESYRFSREQVGDVQQKKRNIANFLSDWENANPNELNTILRKYDLLLMMTGEFLE
ncbi:MAG: hypothetical protein ACK5D5_06685 [Bacteroidota bacterium]